MTSIETAARALAKQQSGADDYDALDPELQHTLRDEVRAVLRAVRQPSPVMIGAGQDRMDAVPAVVGAPATPESIWRRMLDTALDE